MAEQLKKTVTYEELMADSNVAKGREEIAAAIEADPATMKLLDAAKSVEDMYAVTVRFLTLSFEAFKTIFQKTIDYFSSARAELPDEVLDNVAGGWSLSGVFESLSKKVWCVAGCIVGGVLVAGGVAAGIAATAVAGPVALVVGSAVALLGATMCHSSIQYASRQS